jgi:hypothetical protein
VAEAAREEEWRHHGFVRDLFDGGCAWTSSILPAA